MMGFSETARIAFRSLARHRMRTVFCILAIVFATFINIQGTGIWDGIFESWVHAAYVYDMGHLRVSTRDFVRRAASKPLKYPIVPEGTGLDRLLSEIEAIPGVERAFPRLETKATLLEGEVKNASLWGLRFGEEIGQNNFNYREKSSGVIQGRFPRQYSNECMVGCGLAERMKIKIGDGIPMELASSGGSNVYADPTVVGIFDFDFTLYNNNYIVLDFDAMQKMTGLEGRTQTISVFCLDSWVNDSGRQMDLEKRIQGMFTDSQIIVESWTNADSNILTDVKVFKRVIAIVYLVFSIMAGFLILNTIAMIVIERYWEIGLLGSLGMNRHSILLTFFMEGLFMGLIGTLSGMILGGVEVYVLSGFPIDIAMLFGSGDLPYSATFYLKFAFDNLLKNGTQAFAVTILCSVIPVMRILRIDPMDAMRK
jgi:ABC-type lipoprotein release transport system permease subunit